MQDLWFHISTIVLLAVDRWQQWPGKFVMLSIIMIGLTFIGVDHVSEPGPGGPWP